MIEIAFGIFILLFKVLFSDISLLTVTTSSNRHNLTRNIITEKNRIIVSFTSAFDNLGIISVYGKLINNTEGNIDFRIKQEGDDNWYYEKTISSFDFINTQPFPFGFPPIRQSSGKNLIYELSFSDNLVKSDRPITNLSYEVKSLFNKSRFLKLEYALSFLSHKIDYAIYQENFIRDVILYVFALLIFILLQQQFLADFLVEIIKSPKKLTAFVIGFDIFIGAFIENPCLFYISLIFVVFNILKIKNSGAFIIDYLLIISIFMISASFMRLDSIAIRSGEWFVLMLSAVIIIDIKSKLSNSRL